MLTLYRSSHLLSEWVAYSENLGWVVFPARVNGWSARKPYSGETASLMRIPPRLGFLTGFPHPDATPVRDLHEHVFQEVVARIGRKVA